ncbi:Zinc finger CCCH domain-containing protein 55 [Linum grandiflorum]
MLAFTGGGFLKVMHVVILKMWGLGMDIDLQFDCLFFVVAGFNGRVMVGSPREMESLYLQQREGMMRLKAAHQQQQQRLAYNKYMNLLLQQQNDPQRLGAEEFHKFGRFCPERNEIFAMSMSEKANSVARQIYLTFPADSTFKDEDVSNYFSTFGPVEDVRIPYQQKRMFGFVTFLHAETVKLILARGNPHFICDSRVLVKPYKEKGRQQHHLHHQVMDRGNFSSCSSPSGVDVRELYDLPVGPRMTYNSQELMLRRKLEEQAELQVAIELQGRRLVNLQLPNMRGDYVHHHQRSLSIGAPVSMSAQSPLNQNIAFESEPITEAFENSADDAAKQNSLTDVKMPCNIVVDKEEDTNPDSTNMNNCHDEDLDRPRASTEMKGSSSLEEDDEHMPITSL